MIYFAQAGPDGPIKIGFSTNPSGRLISLRTSAHVEIRLLVATAGDQADEERLHEQFAQLRVRGEWFRPSDDLLRYISQVMPCALPASDKQQAKRKRPLPLPPPTVTTAELRAWRHAADISQSEAAAKLGVSLKTYQNWEQGQRRMRHPIAMRKLMAQARPRRGDQ